MGRTQRRAGPPLHERGRNFVDDALDDAAGVAGALLAGSGARSRTGTRHLPEQHVYDLIVPNFNAPDFLERCLDSLIAHTDHRHLIHVVDDASTDPRVDPLLRRYAARHSHLRYYRLPTNLGFPGAVNAALAEHGKRRRARQLRYRIPAGVARAHGPLSAQRPVDPRRLAAQQQRHDLLRAGVQ